MNPVLTHERAALVVGDSLRLADLLPENSIDAVVTDPPYELGFMGKTWDASGIAYDPKLWAAVLRALKPGGHLLAFGGTRTYHRMTCAIEDAGFEIRDSLHWMYGTGFPKSLDVSKAIDAAHDSQRPGIARLVEAWQGWGTALKPGHEPIVLARKPLEGTVAANVAKWGTGALNIDSTRIGESKDVPASAAKDRIGQVAKGDERGRTMNTPGFDPTVGRWPANVLLDEDAAAELDAQSGHLKSGLMKAGTIRGPQGEVYNKGFSGQPMPRDTYADSGGASRFFYVAKPSRAERDLGCDHLPPRSGGEATERKDGSEGLNSPRAGAGRTGGARNYHPTVKPVALLRYLVRLVTPPGGVVLDPFTGSGTTGMAAVLEGFGFVGVELSDEYAVIAKARIEHALKSAEGKAA